MSGESQLPRSRLSKGDSTMTQHELLDMQCRCLGSWLDDRCPNTCDQEDGLCESCRERKCEDALTDIEKEDIMRRRGWTTWGSSDWRLK